MAIIKNPMTIMQSGSGENKIPQIMNKTITTLTVEDLAGATQIPNYAFQDCIDLTSVEFSSTLQTIYSYVFSGCSSLTSIDFGENSQLTSIGSYAFDECSRLNSVTLPSSLISIGSNAFRGCSSLSSITIPEGVTSIGSYAFHGCTYLTTMRVKALTPPTLSSTNAISTATTQIQVPMASVDAYKTATNWSNFADIIVGYDT